MTFKIFFVHLFVLLISNNSYAQQDTLVLTPESGLINGAIIEGYINKWRVTLISEDGKETPNKTWTDYGQIIELDGKNYFHRVQDLYDPEMNLIDTWINMVEHKSLLPVSNSTLNPTGGYLNIQFDGNSAKGITNQVEKGEVTEFNVAFEDKVYDRNLYGMLLVGLPLKKGLIAKLPYYDLQSNSQQWLALSVTTKESLTLPDDKKVITWKVETNNNLTFWISKSAPYVIKLESYRPDKSKLVWEMF